MIPVLSRDQIRAFDRHAIETCHVPSLVLMENAGRGATERVVRALESRPGDVVVVCGAGNNGGDGFVVARLLATRGFGVSVLFASSRDRLKGDALANHDAWVGLGGRIISVSEPDPLVIEDELRHATIIVDALLGTGLDREVTGFTKVVIEAMNESNAYRIALDLPSGLDANTGRVLGAAIFADETVTFAAHKTGLFTSRAVDLTGKITLADIGVPSLVGAVGQSARLLERSDVAQWLRPRSSAAHKGSAGRVVIVGGAPGKTGAALLSARAALRAGAGLVTIATVREAAAALDARVLEEMTAVIESSDLPSTLGALLRGANVVAVGPGLGLDATGRAVTDYVVGQFAGLKVVDADALTHLAGRLGELRAAPGAFILTPHPGEMARLLDVTTEAVESDRFAAVSRAVEASGAVVVLKGAHSLIGAPGELPVVSPIACSALATAGSGDVLTGITAALGASVPAPLHAACSAVFVHGTAGELWGSETGSDRGLVAHEIAERVPAVIASLRG